MCVKSCIRADTRMLPDFVRLNHAPALLCDLAQAHGLQSMVHVLGGALLDCTTHSGCPRSRRQLAVVRWVSPFAASGSAAEGGAQHTTGNLWGCTATYRDSNVVLTRSPGSFMTMVASRGTAVALRTSAAHVVLSFRIYPVSHQHPVCGVGVWVGVNGLICQQNYGRGTTDIFFRVGPF